MRLVRVPLVQLGSRLGAGQMSSPEVSPDALLEIRKIIDATLGELEYQLEAVYAEERTVEPATLRVEPALYRDVSDVGDWDPVEVRSQIAADALALSGVAGRLSSGSVSSYLSREQAARAQAAGDRAKKIWDYLRSLDSVEVRGDHGDASARHLAMHMTGLDQDVAQIEKAVVTAEAGAVPVVEPYERTSKTVQTVAIVGGIGVALLVIFNLFRG